MVADLLRISPSRRRPSGEAGLPHKWGRRCLAELSRLALLEVLLLQQLPVARVGQALDGVGDRQPGQLVDLDAGSEPPALDLHEPVAGDLVAAAPVDVRRASERALDLAADRKSTRLNSSHRC